MEGIAEWLAKISWPLVSRVLVSLGFGYTTYEGADTAITNAISSIQGAFAGLGA